MTNNNQFDRIVDYVIRLEGKDVVDHPHDKGKITKFGISLRFLKTIPIENLKKYGIFDIEINEDTVRFLSLDQAKAIYKGEFWDQAPFEHIRNEDHCRYIFDMAVNMGIAPAIKCVQRASWAVMKRRELIDDGILGNKTLSMIERCGFLMMPAMRSERAGYYRLVAQNDSSQDDFINGWLKRAYES